MKIDQIILSLQSIKKENDENISDNNLKINELEKQIRKLESKLNELQRKESKYNKLGIIRGSMLKTIKILLIPLELAIIASLLMLMVFLAENFYLNLTLSSLCCLFTFDIIYTYYKDIYPASDQNAGIIKSVFEIFRELLHKKEYIQDKTKEINKEKDSTNNELKEVENKRNSLLIKNSTMKEENEYLEGNEVGLHILEGKYQMEDISDNLEIVKYVGKRLERRPE